MAYNKSYYNTNSSPNTSVAHSLPYDECRLLSLRISQVTQDITINHIYAVCNRNNCTVVQIVISSVIVSDRVINALVEFKSPEEARRMQAFVHKRYMFAGSCFMEATINRCESLNVVGNSEKQLKEKAPVEDYDRNAPNYKDHDRNAPSYKDHDRNAPSYKDYDRNAPSYKDYDRNAPSYKDHDRNVPSYSEIKRDERSTYQTDEEKRDKELYNTQLDNSSTLSTCNVEKVNYEQLSLSDTKHVKMEDVSEQLSGSVYTQSYNSSHFTQSYNSSYSPPIYIKVESDIKDSPNYEMSKYQSDQQKRDKQLCSTLLDNTSLVATSNSNCEKLSSDNFVLDLLNDIDNVATQLSKSVNAHNTFHTTPFIKIEKYENDDKASPQSDTSICKSNIRKRGYEQSNCSDFKQHETEEVSHDHTPVSACSVSSTRPPVLDEWIREDTKTDNEETIKLQSTRLPAKSQVMDSRRTEIVIGASDVKPYPDNFKPVSIPLDDNSLFSSVAYHIFGAHRLQRVVRLAAVDHMKYHLPYFQDKFLRGSRSRSKRYESRSFVKFLRNMPRQIETEEDELCLLALAETYKLQIDVYFVANQRPRCYSYRPDRLGVAVKKTIELYFNRTHYVPLVINEQHLKVEEVTIPQECQNTPRLSSNIQNNEKDIVLKDCTSKVESKSVKSEDTKSGKTVLTQNHTFHENSEVNEPNPNNREESNSTSANHNFMMLNINNVTSKQESDKSTNQESIKTIKQETTQIVDNPNSIVAKHYGNVPEEERSKTDCEARSNLECSDTKLAGISCQSDVPYCDDNELVECDNESIEDGELVESGNVPSCDESDNVPPCDESGVVGNDVQTNRQNGLVDTITTVSVIGGRDVKPYPDKFKPVSVPEDENSLFSSISYHVYGSDILHGVVRFAAVEHMRNYPSCYYKETFQTVRENSKPQLEQYKEKSFEKFLEIMSESETEGEELCLKALADVYKLQIDIYFLAPYPKCRSYYPQKQDFDLTVKAVALYFNRTHYIPLVLNEQPSVVQELTIPVTEHSNIPLRISDIQKKKIEIVENCALKPGSKTLKPEGTKNTKSSLAQNGFHHKQTAVNQSNPNNRQESKSGSIKTDSSAPGVSSRSKSSNKKYFSHAYKAQKIDFHVLSLNVRGFASERKQEKVRSWLSDHNVELAALQEISPDVPRESNWSDYRLLSHDDSSSYLKVQRCGFMVSQHLVSKITRHEDISVNIQVLYIRPSQNLFLCVINANAPQETSSAGKKYEFFSTLSTTIAKANSHVEKPELIVVGDFNAHVGHCDVRSSEHFPETALFHEVSDDNGIRLINVIEETSLTLIPALPVNYTLKTKVVIPPISERWTYCAERGGKAQLDYVFIAPCESISYSVLMFNPLSYISYHKFMMVNIKINKQNIQPVTNTKQELVKRTRQDSVTCNKQESTEIMCNQNDIMRNLQQKGKNKTACESTNKLECSVLSRTSCQTDHYETVLLECDLSYEQNAPSDIPISFDADLPYGDIPYAAFSYLEKRDLTLLAKTESKSSAIHNDGLRRRKRSPTQVDNRNDKDSPTSDNSVFNDTGRYDDNLVSTANETSKTKQKKKQEEKYKPEDTLNISGPKFVTFNFENS